MIAASNVKRSEYKMDDEKDDEIEEIVINLSQLVLKDNLYSNLFA
jgi:hypothetical protein